MHDCLQVHFGSSAVVDYGNTPAITQLQSAPDYVRWIGADPARLYTIVMIGMKL
jgi:hypothetical protein